jgi:hypothetical protein
MVRTAVFIICSFFMACIAHAQPSCKGVFCSGFEEGSKAVWDDWDGNPDSTNLIMADPGAFNVSGNHVMRLRAPAGRGGADLVKVLPGKYDKLYARWYQKWEPGYNFDAPCHGGGLHAGDRDLLGRSDFRPQGNDWFCTWIEPYKGRLQLYSYYRGMYQDCVDPQGSCWGDVFPCTADEGSNYCEKTEHRDKSGKMPPQLQTGRWYCIEIMLEAGSAVSADSLANGRQDFWIDGVEYGPFERLWHRTTADVKISILWLSLFHHDATHSVEGVMLDDVVVASERIGPASAQIQPPPEKKPASDQLIRYRNGRLQVPDKFLTARDISVEFFNTSGQRVVNFPLIHGKGASAKPPCIEVATRGVRFCRFRVDRQEEVYPVLFGFTKK